MNPLILILAYATDKHMHTFAAVNNQVSYPNEWQQNEVCKLVQISSLPLGDSHHYVQLLPLCFLKKLLCAEVVGKLVRLVLNSQQSASCCDMTPRWLANDGRPKEVLLRRGREVPFRLQNTKREKKGRWREAASRCLPPPSFTLRGPMLLRTDAEEGGRGEWGTVKHVAAVACFSIRDSTQHPNTHTRVLAQKMESTHAHLTDNNRWDVRLRTPKQHLFFAITGACDNYFTPSLMSPHKTPSNCST